MTVSSTTVKNSYSGNGSTTQFAYGYKIFADSDLIVIIRVNSTGTETVKTLTTHYTVAGAGDASGGSITFTSGNTPASGETVVIIREVPQTQAIDYIANDPFPAESHEEGLDRGTMTTQQVQEEVDRSLKLSRTNTMTSTEFTVGATDRANKVLSFDSSGELSVTQELGTFRGNWSASTAYQVRDIVKDTSTNNIFMANTAHTSSGSQPLTSNTDSAKWDLIVDAASSTTSQNAAAASATASANSATASGNSATASANSATASANSATASANSATASGNSATAAATSETNAAASFDSFDDRYLGAKSSAPSTDNDGNALLTGALYFNSSSNQIFSWTGSAWQAIKPTSSEQTNINALSASAVIADMAILGTTDVVNDMNILATTDVVSDMNTLATSDVVADMNTLGTADVVNDMNVLGSSATVTAMNVLGTSAVVADLAILGTTDVVNDMNVLGTSANVTAMNLLGTSAVVTDMGILGTADVVSDMNTLGTADVVNDMNVLGTSANVTAMNTLGTSTNVTNMATVSANIAGVNSFAERYRVVSSNPTSSLDAGDLAFVTGDSNLKFYNGSSWVSIAPGIANVVDDSTPQLGGDLASNGNDILFADNDKAKFGTGNDLEIFHDGSNSNISDVGTGKLVLRTDGAGIDINKSSSENMAKFITDGAVELYHNNAKKFETTSTGATVTGATNVDAGGEPPAEGMLLLQANSSNRQLRISPPSNSANGKIDFRGGNLTFQDDGTEVARFQGTTGFGIGTSSPVSKVNIEDTKTTALSSANDFLTLGLTIDDNTAYNEGVGGGITFRGKRQSGGQQTVFGAIAGTKIDNSNDGYNGNLRFFTNNNSNGVPTEHMRIHSDGKIGIGETAPLGKLHVKTADSGATVNGVADELVLEGSGRSGMTILSGTSSIGTVGFGDSGNNIIGSINYNHDGNLLTIFTNDAERMRIDSSGNVGIGTSSPSSYYANHLVVDIGSTAQSGITIVADSSNQAMLAFADGTSGDTRYRGYLDYNHSNDSLAFASAGSEAMRINSGGQILIGTSSAGALTNTKQLTTHDGNSTYGLRLNSTNTSGTQYHQSFDRNGTQAGYITSNSATTIAFNNASDERLKENIENSGSAIQDIKDLKVRQFDWKDNIDTHKDFGFVAQELVNVVPEAVTEGTDELDDNGKPVRSWGVDYSHIVPRLVKAVQEQQTKIENLEAEVTALKNQP